MHDVSAEIDDGEFVAFIGPSGTGKSTLLSLMLRFYDPTEGALLLGRDDFRTIRISDVRAHMALVSQESVILPATAAENIAYGRPGATRRDLQDAAALAGAAEFIEQLPEGYDTILAEGGQNLSGGQRQRIAIARALVTNAPFLILDEPTSALDPRHEQHLVATLLRLGGMRTVILVTHRLQSVAQCNEIFVMQNGTIAERGKHDALLARDGAYARMWDTATVEQPAA